MRDKVLVILSTSEKEKLLTGLLYATNCLRHEWMREVRVVVFGPSQRVAVEDEEVQSYLRLLVDSRSVPLACKYLADQMGLTTSLDEMGMDVVYVGSVVSRLIQEGFVPLVF